MSLAAALRGGGMRVAIVDPGAAPVAADDDFDTRIYAISPGSQQFLDACGAWQYVRAERVERVEAMHVHGDAEQAELYFRAYDAGRAELCFIVESGAIQSALAQALAHRDDLFACYGSNPSALEFTADDARVELADGREVRAKLVVGADGADSWIRATAGIETRLHDYRQIGIVANFASELAHGCVARQWFRSDGVLALLPLPGNRVSMVWSTFDAAAERLLALDREALAEEVTRASGAALGTLVAISQARDFPLRRLSVAELVRP